MSDSTIGRREFLAAAAAVTLSARSVASAAAPQGVEALAEATRAQLKAPGLAYGVVRDGRVVVKGGVGTKELGKPAAVDSRTLFHMASVTKPFVATAIMQRVERGRLRLDQRLADALPELRLTDPRAASITLEQVLAHTAGLPDVTDYQWQRPEFDAEALRRYVAGLSDMQLIFDPGKGFEYSNIGFELLARVIEVLDGVPFETAIRRTILEPLGMNSSTLLYPEADKSRLAAPHMLEKDGQVRRSAVFPYNRRHAGSSTLISCVDDMLRWVRLNLGEGQLDGVRIMSEKTARDLRTPRSGDIGGESFPPGARAALSWFVLPLDGQEIVAHGGLDIGFMSMCMFAPRERFGLVAMANCASEAGTGPLLQFAQSVLAEKSQ